MDLFSKVLRRITRQQNLLLVILIGGFTSIIIFSVHHSYKKQLELFLSEKTNYLSGIVKTTVGLIDGDRYEELLNTANTAIDSDTSHYYHKLKRLLAGVQVRNGLGTEIYTLSELPGKGNALHLVVNSGDSIWFKHAYEAPTVLHEQYAQGGQIGPYEDEHGKWISASTPIYNSHREVVGSLQADMSFMEFEQLAKANVVEEATELSIFYAIVLILLVVVTRFKVSQIRRLQHTFFQMSDAMDQRNLQLIDAHETIEKRNIELSLMNEQLEYRIRERTRQVEQKNEELNTFFYHASHQMKTPVVNILGLVELAKLEKHETEVLEHLNKIGKLSQRTIRLLNQLNKAAYTNPDTCESIKLHQFIESRAKDHPLRNCVNMNIACDGDEFATNPYLLQVVFDSVLENAIYFSGKTANGQAAVNVKCSVADGNMTATITDNGMGIPPDQIDRVADLFYIGSPISKGNGLGLYLAQHTLQKLGGKMTITSVVDEFTTVELFIPPSVMPAHDKKLV